MTCDKCKYFKVLYEPLRTEEILWDFGRAKCDKHNLITDFANHGKFKRLDTCENFESQESEDKKMGEISEIEIKSMTKEQNYMRGYKDGKSDVLDKIKAEIEELIEWHDCPVELDGGNDLYYREACKRAIKIIDKYKKSEE